MTVAAPSPPRIPPWRHIDPVAVGRRIRECRVAAGLSQRQVAFQGCSAAYISRLEAGDRTPSGHLLEELASRIDTSAAYLETGQHLTAIYLPQHLVEAARDPEASPEAWGDLCDALMDAVQQVASPNQVIGLA